MKKYLKSLKERISSDSSEDASNPADHWKDQYTNLLRNVSYNLEDELDADVEFCGKFIKLEGENQVYTAELEPPEVHPYFDDPRTVRIQVKEFEAEKGPGLIESSYAEESITDFIAEEYQLMEGIIGGEAFLKDLAQEMEEEYHFDVTLANGWLEIEESSETYFIETKSEGKSPELQITDSRKTDLFSVNEWEIEDYAFKISKFIEDVEENPPKDEIDRELEI